MPVNISECQSSAWNRPGRPERTFVERLFCHPARSVSTSKVGVHSLLNRCKLCSSMGRVIAYLVRKSCALG